MASISLDDLPIELQTLIAQMQTQGTRSPVRQPLSDLRDPGDPKKRINRPNFFFEQTNSYTVPAPFPKLRFALKDGRLEEVVVRSSAEESALGPEWGDYPVSMPEQTDAEITAQEQEAVSVALAALPEEERNAILEAVKRHRLEEMTQRVLALPNTDAVAPPKKRGPGRPRGHSA